MQNRKKHTRRRQGEFEFKSWGGARRGAGRKPNGDKSGVTHAVRPLLASQHPVHVTWRMQEGLPSLRSKRVYRALKRAFLGGRDRLGFRLNQYSVQRNHLHLIVEARGSEALSRGLQGLGVRIACALNKVWQRRGRIFGDRFHSRILRSPREVRNVLSYVLNNFRRHGGRLLGPDPYSSAGWFDGWREVEIVGAGPSVITRARTWLLKAGWRRHGLIRCDERPGRGRA